MKRIAESFLLAAAVLLCASCRTTKPGESFIIHITVTGTNAVPLSAIGSLDIEFDPDMRPDVHFDPVVPYVADGGAMVSSLSDGHFLVSYTGDQIRASGLATTQGFEVNLPFYSTDTTMSQEAYNMVSANVTVYNRGGMAMARGAYFLPWPLDTHIEMSPLTIPVQCIDPALCM